jgi:hypothetical protein
LCDRNRSKNTFRHVTKKKKKKQTKKSDFFFLLFPHSTGYTATGSVSVFDNATGAYMTLTGGSLSLNGALVTNAIVAHLHAQACNNGEGGGHFKKDTTIPGAPLSNELWASPNADGANPAVQPATGTWNGASSLLGFTFANRTDVKAVVIHEYNNTDGSGFAPKRVCCDLTLVAAATTTTAGNATAAPGNSTAAPTAAGNTTAGAPAAAACTDAACCTAIDKSPRSCTDCLANAGCEYHANAKNDVIDLGGKCLFKGTAAPVQTKKVEMASQCLDTCSGYSCSECIGKTGCVFCDSAAAASEAVGAKSGLSSGTCEKSCKVAAAQRMTCSGAETVVSAIAVIVSIALMF